MELLVEKNKNFQKEYEKKLKKLQADEKLSEMNTHKDIAKESPVNEAVITEKESADYKADITEEVEQSIKDVVSNLEESIKEQAVMNDVADKISNGVSDTTSDDDKDVFEEIKEDVIDVDDVSKIQVNAVDPNIVSDYIDNGEKLIDENKKMKRRLIIKRVVMSVLLIAIIILLLKSCGASIIENIVVPDIEDSEFVDISSDIPHVDGYTAIPAIGDFTVSKSQPYVTLYNPEINSGYSYLKYRFTDESTGKVIYESKLVEPGQQFSVDFGSLLEIGKHKVLVEILNYDYNDCTVQKNGGQSNITIKIIK